MNKNMAKNIEILKAKMTPTALELSKKKADESRLAIDSQTKLVGIKAVVFDVFGTLVKITDKRRPFVQLMQLFQAAGRRSEPDDSDRIMSNSIGLAGAARMFNVEISASSIADLELELYKELSTLKLYPEVLETFNTLRVGGIKLVSARIWPRHTLFQSRCCYLLN